MDIGRWETHRRARAGLGYVAEVRRLFTGLTVRENLRVAAGPDAALQEARVLDLFPVLKTLLKRPAAHMSGGEQQMLAIARTLMTGPRILLLDEPCEGIASVLVESIRDALLLLTVIASDGALGFASRDRQRANPALKHWTSAARRLRSAPAGRAATRELPAPF